METPAGGGRRLAAFAIDYLIVSSYIVLLALVSLAVSPEVVSRFDLRGAPRWFFDLLAFSTLVLPVILYFALTEASRHRGSVGKRRLGLIVGDHTGRPLARAPSLLRSALKFLPWQVAHTSLFHVPGWPMAVESVPWTAAIGLAGALALSGLYVAGLFTGSRRTLYDRIAGSQVLVASRGSVHSLST